jgi:hypothetical protein
LWQTILYGIYSLNRVPQPPPSRWRLHVYRLDGPRQPPLP